MGPSSDFGECISDPMESLDESVPLSTLESASPMSSTSVSTPNVSNSGHPELAERNLVSIAPLNDQTATTDSSTNNDSSQLTRRRSTQEEPTMASTSMEHKRQRLEHHGYDDNAIAIFLNPEAQPSIKRYNTIQQRFVRWCKLHHFDAGNPDPAQLVNYLVYGHHTLKWTVAICLNYKSATLALYGSSSRQLIQSDEHFQRFFTNLRALTVRSFDKPDYDLTPVVDILRSWGYQ